MARFYGADVSAKIKTILTASLNTTLATIKTARSDSGLEDVRVINIGIVDRNFPECVINLQDSELIVDELNLDIADTPEEFPAEVLILFKDNTVNTALRLEYYIEALQKIFHGYKDADISWIAVTGSIRADAYNEQRETFKIAGVNITVRIY
jgi:hypothetical protein